MPVAFPGLLCVTDCSALVLWGERGESCASSFPSPPCSVRPLVCFFVGGGGAWREMATLLACLLTFLMVTFGQRKLPHCDRNEPMTLGSSNNIYTHVPSTPYILPLSPATGIVRAPGVRVFRPLPSDRLVPDPFRRSKDQSVQAAAVWYRIGKSLLFCPTSRAYEIELPVDIDKPLHTPFGQGPTPRRCFWHMYGSALSRPFSFASADGVGMYHMLWDFT